MNSLKKIYFLLLPLMFACVSLAAEQGIGNPYIPQGKMKKELQELERMKKARRNQKPPFELPRPTRPPQRSSSVETFLKGGLLAFAAASAAKKAIDRYNSPKPEPPKKSNGSDANKKS